MSDKIVKILKNVFLPANDNRLTLDDIQFSSHIEKITDQTSADINWKEIDSPEKRYKLFGQLTEKEYIPELKTMMVNILP